MMMPLCRRYRHKKQVLKVLVVRVVKVLKMKAMFPGHWLQVTTTTVGLYLDHPVDRLDPPW